METEKLESYTQETFGMKIHEFLKQKIEVENLYNYEVARFLNIKKKDVGILIKRMGINRNGFNIRFESKYGIGAIYLFKQMIACPKNTLADVARHFGFSREYARYVYEKIYGYTYTREIKKRRFERLEAKRRQYKEPVKCILLRELVNLMASLGFEPQMRKENKSYKIYLNGYKVGFRYNAKPSVGGKKRYFRIAYKERSILGLDFIIFLCHYKGESTYYILPKEDLPKTGLCFIPEAEDHESKYQRFKDAWDLLHR